MGFLIKTHNSINPRHDVILNSASQILNTTKMTICNEPIADDNAVAGPTTRLVLPAFKTLLLTVFFQTYSPLTDY